MVKIAEKSVYLQNLLTHCKILYRSKLVYICEIFHVIFRHIYETFLRITHSTKKAFNSDHIYFLYKGRLNLKGRTSQVFPYTATYKVVALDILKWAYFYNLIQNFLYFLEYFIFTIVLLYVLHRAGNKLQP